MKDILDPIIKTFTGFLFLLVISCDTDTIKGTATTTDKVVSPDGKFIARIIAINSFTDYYSRISLSLAEDDKSGDVVFDSVYAFHKIKWSDDSSTFTIFYNFDDDLNRCSVKKDKWKNVQIMYKKIK